MEQQWNNVYNAEGKLIAKHRPTPPAGTRPVQHLNRLFGYTRAKGSQAEKADVTLDPTTQADR